MLNRANETKDLDDKYKYCHNKDVLNSTLVNLYNVFVVDKSSTSNQYAHSMFYKIITVQRQINKNPDSIIISDTAI